MSLRHPGGLSHPCKTLAGCDSVGRIVFSGLSLLGPVEDKKLGPGQHLTVVAQESWSRAKWGGTLESALPRVRLSPIPVLTQKVPSFRLSHRVKENLCEAGG